MKPGDRIVIKTKSESFDGVLIPCVDDDILMLKLDNGYNIGIDKSRIISSKVVKAYKVQKKVLVKTSQKKGLPTIALLHTGGTIASKVDYETGGTKAQFTPEDLLQMFPELKKRAKISSRLVANMFSEDMRFSHYNILAKEVVKEIKKGVDGIIITHGTDTIHYTSAALSFILENLSVPVLLVGAQRSSDRPSSDAATNLIAATEFITQTDFVGTSIVMHDSSDDKYMVLLPGLKTKKLHTSRRNAFKAVNAEPFARVDIRTWKVHKAQKFSSTPSGKLVVRLFKEDVKVGVLRVHTHMFAEEFLAYKNFDGLIIEGTGIAGNIPLNVIDDHTKEHAKIAKVVQQLVKKGVVIAATAQTVFGRLNMNVYTTGRKMKELGILGNHLDIPTDTAFVKLAWLLSNFSPKKTKEFYGTNLRGEISERIKYNVLE